MIQRTITISILLLVGMGVVQAAERPAVSLVLDPAPGIAARHGIAKVLRALEDKGLVTERVASIDTARSDTVLVAGVASGGAPAASLLDAQNIPAPEGPEALVIEPLRKRGRDILLVCGSDDRGLMYALLEVAERIGWSGKPAKPFIEVDATREKPYSPERALTKMVINRSEFERYCFSEEYWDEYLDMLAANRFNTFHLLFGYTTDGYFEPIYPYMFDVEEFPGIYVEGITKEQQRRNLDMLRMILRKTHEHGLDFTLGLWTHIKRTATPVPGIPFGVTDDNLIPYTEAAMRKFLERVPGLDALQFRVHVESALLLPQPVEFWTTIFKVIKESGQDIRVDMRSKGFTDDMIAAVLGLGVPMRLTTKYWGEQMGMPFHPTHIKVKNQLKRRHSYADLLRYPRRYAMHWRLWNYGTTRILLWGDPDYARRYAESTHMWSGDGFEVSEPLAMKMHHARDKETYDLLNEPYQYYRWEFQRYWHFYQVFGRMGYNPDASPEIWRKEFERRFGREAAPYIEEAIHLSGKILPKIVAYNLPNLSSESTWAEKERWHDLEEYIINAPSDTAQFVGIEEAARLQIEGRESPKIWPQKTSQWFESVAFRLRELIAHAEKRIGENRNKEFVSTLVDLKILAGLAEYHGRRIHAGVNYAMFQYTNDISALDTAFEHEREAVAAWEQIVADAADVYHDNLIFGRENRGLTGHWKHELDALKQGLGELLETRNAFQPKWGETVARFDFGDAGAAEGYEPVERGKIYNPIRGGYGWTHVYAEPRPKIDPNSAQKDPNADFVHGPPPSQYAYSGFAADMPNGHYELTVTMKDTTENPRDYGPMWIVANGMDSTRHFVVPAGEEVKKIFATAVTDGRLNIVFNATSGGTWIVNSLAVKRAGPEIAHVPTRKAAPGAALSINATVGPSEGLASVHLTYGSTEDGYTRVSMQQTGPHRYGAAIPESSVEEGVAYFIEAADHFGRLATYPRADVTAPIMVTVTLDNEPPTVAHDPVASWPMGKALSITTEVRDPSGVAWVRVRYRGVNQHQDFRTLVLFPTGQRHTYQAEIPAAHIRPEWDLMYYLEVMDAQGNGTIHPDLEKETPYIVVELDR